MLNPTEYFLGSGPAELERLRLQAEILRGAYSLAA
jgi:hypothetical protein